MFILKFISTFVLKYKSNLKMKKEIINNVRIFSLKVLWFTAFDIVGVIVGCGLIHLFK